MFAEPHDLTRLPDVFSVTNNMVKGAALGSFAGALLAVPVWVVATAAGA